jgi:hypothetical protein
MWERGKPNTFFIISVVDRIPIRPGSEAKRGLKFTSRKEDLAHHNL